MTSGLASVRGPTIVLAIFGAACASAGPAPTPSAELARLTAEAAANPTDGATTLRLAAAQQAAGSCATAIETARRGMQVRPQDALGPLVLGGCLEESGDIGEAVAVYDSYTNEYANSVGAPAVAARAMLARRGLAAAEARELLSNEAALGATAADQNVLAIMPLEVIGDEQYEALSFGLASMLTSDLALLQQLTLVERAQLDALVREIQLGQTGVIDPATAARAGRMLRAGRVAHGLTHVAPDERLRLEVSLMDASSRIIGTESVSGGLRDLFSIEKELVLALVARMGYPLSESERLAILENGTRSLAAFLAYSRGLLEQEAGNYAAAAAEFSQAVREDPGFQAARDGFQVSSGAAAVQDAGPGAVATLSSTPASNPLTPPAGVSLGAALAGGVMDVSPTLGEALGTGTGGVAQAAVTTTSATPPSVVAGGLEQTVLFNFRVILRLP
jgi:tetratricopeptide (TPR) repeat protein